MEIKINKKECAGKPMRYVEAEYYNHYVAIDWSSTIMSVAKMSSNSSYPQIVKELPATIKSIKDYLKKLSGKIILTIEETTGAQWLYVELKDFVEKIIICDPYRNSLLREGPKNDPKDAAELCRLLRAGMLKEVYHSNDENYKIRKLASSYNDLIKAGVRAKNQLSAIYRGFCLDYKKETFNVKDDMAIFVIEEKQRYLELYEKERKEYIKIFRKLKKKNSIINYLTGIGGIDIINAVKIFSVVIDANRFPTKYKYYSYCGLVKYKMESGGKLYGKKDTKYNRILKGVYKTATLAALRGHNDIREYYEVLLKEGYAEKESKNIITRYIAKSTLAMMKNNTKYKPYSWRVKTENKTSQ